MESSSEKADKIPEYICSMVQLGLFCPSTTRLGSCPFLQVVLSLEKPLGSPLKVLWKHVKHLVKFIHLCYKYLSSIHYVPLYSRLLNTKDIKHPKIPTHSAKHRRWIKKRDVSCKVLMCEARYIVRSLLKRWLLSKYQNEVEDLLCSYLQGNISLEELSKCKGPLYA